VARKPQCGHLEAGHVLHSIQLADDQKGWYCDNVPRLCSHDVLGFLENLSARSKNSYEHCTVDDSTHDPDLVTQVFVKLAKFDFDGYTLVDHETDLFRSFRKGRGFGDDCCCAIADETEGEFGEN
jgi:hypothetical protein